MVYKMNESIIVIQAEATSPNRTNVVFWSHDRGTAKLRMKLVRKDGIPQSLPEGTTVPIRLMFKSATAEGGYGKHDYLATIEDPVNGIVSIVLEDNILGYVGTVEGSVYIDFPNDQSLDTAGRFTFDIKRSPIDDSTPELEDYYFNGFSQTIDKIEKILADGKLEIEQKIAESETQIDAKLKDTNDKITKANQDVATLDQNLTELRNDMKLSEAWAWSADGTDRFTPIYPRENLFAPVKYDSNVGYIDFVDGTGKTIVNSSSYRYSDYIHVIGTAVVMNIIETTTASPIGFKIFAYDTDQNFLGNSTQISFDYPRKQTWTLPENTAYIRYYYPKKTGCKAKLEIGDTPTIYTPAPSEDYVNAYPTYKGISIVDSNNPNDYSWDVTPEYAEKGLNNAVNVYDPQRVEGLKNFADGIQIAGDRVVGENEHTIYKLDKSNSNSFIDGYATFIKHGKIVIVNGTVKFKKAYAFGVPLDDEVPEEFIARGVNGMIIGASGTSNSAKMIYVKQGFKSIMTNSEFAINEWFTFNGSYWVGEE